MDCEAKNNMDCPCTSDCGNHNKCCACVAQHTKGGKSLPACMRDIGKDK